MPNAAPIHRPVVGPAGDAAAAGGDPDPALTFCFKRLIDGGTSVMSNKQMSNCFLPPCPNGGSTLRPTYFPTFGVDTDDPESDDAFDVRSSRRLDPEQGHERPFWSHHHALA
jgi:hypothetical protein